MDYLDSMICDELNDLACEYIDDSKVNFEKPIRIHGILYCSQNDIDNAYKNGIITREQHHKALKMWRQQWRNGAINKSVAEAVGRILADVSESYHKKVSRLEDYD